MFFHRGERTKTFIGKRTKIREYVTINRGTKDLGETRVGSDCLLMAINKQSEPTLVSPRSFVPRLIVTYSLIFVRLPITVFVLSPLNFRSWGISPIELECKILHSSPIVVSEQIVTKLPISQLSPIIAFFSITEYGPILTLLPIDAVL